MRILVCKDPVAYSNTCDHVSRSINEMRQCTGWYVLLSLRSNIGRRIMPQRSYVNKHSVSFTVTTNTKAAYQSNTLKYVTYNIFCLKNKFTSIYSIHFVILIISERLTYHFFLLLQLFNLASFIIQRFQSKKMMGKSFMKI